MSHSNEFEQLLYRASEGDREALELLNNNYFDHICRIIKRRLEKRHISGSVRPSDIFNDVMLHILQHPGQLKSHDLEYLLRYVLKIADARILDALRQLIARQRDIRRPKALAAESAIEDPHPGPEETAERNELLELASQRLGVVDRRILLWGIEGLTWKQIGRRLGVAPDAARKSFERTIQWVRQRFVTEG